ncbi:MAG TPA: TonB-dependent receptor [Vicinamibacterales bacterium]|nr:TonB-dependent receptor [Vicinamibacterales bacterium]
MPIIARLLLCGACVLMLPPIVLAQVSNQDLRTLTLDELMKLDVTTVSKFPQPRWETPASVFVLTDADIERSGATTLPEVLRLVPGLHVAQIDGNKWAIGIRGFTDRLARAMLVLVDGRAVYDPLFAGTYWEVQDIPLDDIERIEVVRGPGGALWGANAVTGVVNIIRKAPSAVQGTAVTLLSGTSDPVLASARYGGARGDAFQYRVSGEFAARSPQTNALGLDYDDAKRGQAGFRADWTTANGLLTFQGDGYHSVIGQRDTLTMYSPPSAQNIVTPDPLSGANALARWTRTPADPRSAKVQTYYDYTSRSELVFQQQQHTWDLDYQQGTLAGRHELLWGAGYRLVSGATQTEGTLRFDPPTRTDNLMTAFVQDGVTFLPERLSLTAGVKIEHNAYTGFEWQPNGRLTWSLAPTRVVTLSVTRAIRTPSRVETDFETGSLLNPAVPSFLRLLPNPDFRSEELIAYEAGFSTMVGTRILATVSVFHNEHDNVLSTLLGPAFVETGAGGSRTIFPLQFSNGLRGHSDGVETTADVRLMPWWRLTGHYSFFRLDLFKKPGGQDLSQELRNESGFPSHQVQLTSSVDVGRRVSVDWFFRYLSGVPTFAAPAYSTSNLRANWHVRTGVDLFVVGRNLHRASHFEFSDGSNGQFGIERSVLVGLRWAR